MSDNDLDKYLILDERRNAVDYLTQSLVFLSLVEQNRFYLKWFVIAFHGAIYSMMLLVLQSIDSKLIYKSQPSYKKGEDFTPFDGELLSFLSAYRKLKDTKAMEGRPLEVVKVHDDCMNELHKKLRNQFIHFLPMAWSAESWYPAEVCLPLLDILRFCIQFEKIGLIQTQKETAIAQIDSIKLLLTEHAKSGEF